MARRLRLLICAVRGHEPVPVHFHPADYIPAVRCTRCHTLWHGPGWPVQRKESAEQ